MGAIYGVSSRLASKMFKIGLSDMSNLQLTPGGDDRNPQGQRAICFFLMKVMIRGNGRGVI